MNVNFLLQSENAQRLYEGFARELPIIDFHNHLSVTDLASDRRFESLFDLWLAPDPYKHRLMRICGVAEHYITGDAAPFEKFEKFCAVFPLLAGNPVYDWSRMELSRVFGIEELPSRENARYLYDQCGEMLKSPEFSNNAILGRFGIEYQSPVATPFDDLTSFARAGVAPSLRADDLLAPDEETLQNLQKQAGIAPTDSDSYFSAVARLLDRFASFGCRFADHSLDVGFFREDANGKKAERLVRLAKEYAKRGFTLLLHIGAKRDTSPRLSSLAGRAGGYAAAGEGFAISALADLLGKMEAVGGLPDTLIFPLNLNDQAPVAALQGSYAEDGVASKVGLGPAWWWCDHRLGIENTLEFVASFGVLSQFVGMTTDSRSILSFVRHDYFRRILCSWLDRQNTAGEWNLPLEMQGEIVKKLCYQNAKDKIERKLK